MSSAAKTPVPPEFEKLFKRALDLRNGGNQSEAVPILRQLRDMRPQSASVHAILGEIFWEQRNLDEAIPSFSKAVELSPKSELASLGLFHTLWESGQTQRAIEEMYRFLSMSKSVEYEKIAGELARKQLSKHEEHEEPGERIKPFFQSAFQSRPISSPWRRCPMQVFISWSGDISRQIASALRDWLPLVIQAVEPWMSDQDIAKGTRWLDEIGKQLEHGQLGIVCLTPDNLNSPWIHWEAAALAKGLQKSRVLTYLFGLNHSDVKFPLAQFNHTLANKGDTLNLVKSINEALPEKRLSEALLVESFESFWPKLEAKLDTIRKQMATTTTPAPTQRSQMDIAQEILELIRSLIQREGQLEAWVQTILANTAPPTVTWDPKKGGIFFSGAIPSESAVAFTSGGMTGGGVAISDLVKAISAREQEGPSGPGEPTPAAPRFRRTSTDTR